MWIEPTALDEFEKVGKNSKWKNNVLTEMDLVALKDS